MKTFVLPALSALAGLFLGCLFISLLGVAFGLPFAPEMEGVTRLWWHLDFYEGVWYVGVAFCLLAMITSFVVAHQKNLASIAGATGVCAAVATVVHFSNPPRLMCFLKLPPHLNALPVVALYLCVTSIFCGCGALVGLWWRKELAKDRAESEGPNSGQGRHRTYNLGFTLIELLAVIMILGVLAAILFPVFARSQRSAYASQDMELVRQVYLGITMYEGDHDARSPENLLGVIPKYVPANVFYSKLDERGGGSGASWPVNLFLIPSDGPPDQLYSGYPISFAYLRAFSDRFHAGDTWQTYRDDPNVGMLVDPTIDYRGDPVFSRGPNGAGLNFDRFLVCRMDGSITTRTVPPGCAADTYEGMFLFWAYDCTGGATGPAQ